jgi:hypothetical protein
MRSTRVLAILVVSLAATTLFAQAVRERRNIDCFSDADVALYRRAMQVLVDRNGPKTDPPVTGSYDWYAALHNGDGIVSSCSHGNELFLTWHRALLWEFERALQESDPANGTRGIMLPYWKWSEPPSGDRYPAPFEVQNDVLFAKRKTNQLPKSTLYTATDIARALSAGTWVQFGGASCNDNPDCAGRGGGSLEDPYHNRMHTWVGGGMRVDTEAAVDPLFWSFHAYIDALLAQWQSAHPAQRVGCRNCPFNALPQWTPALVESTEELGYVYEVETCTKAPVPPLLTAAFTAPAQTLDLGTLTKSAAEGPAVFDLRIPDREFRSAELRISGAEVPAEFDYAGSVYLYPQKVKLAPEDPEFRHRYLVEHFGIWAMQKHQHHPGETNVYVDATDVLRYLSRTEPGARWKVAVIVDEVTPLREETAMTPEAVRDLKSVIRFDSVSLVFDRGYEGGAQ